MPTLFSPFGLAKEVAARAQAEGRETIALDMGFAVDENGGGVTMSLKVADDVDASPFAFRSFTPLEFAEFVAELQAMQRQLAHHE